MRGAGSAAFPAKINIVRKRGLEPPRAYCPQESESKSDALRSQNYSTSTSSEVVSERPTASQFGHGARFASRSSTSDGQQANAGRVMRDAMYTIEFYEDEHGDSPVYRWITEDLSADKRRALEVALREILAPRGIGICKLEFGKQLGQGLFELRIRQDAATLLARVGKDPADESGSSEKILLRVFCHAYGDRIVLLLGGYDKAEQPKPRHQNKQIEIARKRLKVWKAAQKSKK